MEQIPDHPVIRSMERTGYLRGCDPRPFTTCDWCGCDIHFGDDYYDIHGEVLCEACVEASRQTAEED